MQFFLFLFQFHTVSIHCSRADSVVDLRFVQLGSNVRVLAKRASSIDITMILMSNYVQDVVALLLQENPHFVDPFLRWMTEQQIQNVY